MIHFLVGKPRNGKSLRAIMHIVSALEKTDRDICTNMSLDLDEMQQLMDDRGHDFSVRHRIRMLSDAEARNFWMYRGRGYDVPKGSDYDEKNGADVDYTTLFRDPRFIRGGQAALDSVLGPLDLRGTLYVIDEAHNYWPARSYQNTPRHASFYCSQHAKLADEVFLITQNTKLIDPNFYRLAQDFTYCRNHRLLKFGMFKGANKFVAKTYESPVTGINEITLNVETFQLDLSVARCYDTSAGVGMPGGGTADRGQRARGVPLNMVWAGLAAVLVLVMFVFGWGMPMFTRRFLAPAIGGEIRGKVDTVKGEAPGARVVSRAVDPAGVVAPAVPAVPDRVTGYAGGQFTATWFEGWLSLNEACGGDGARLKLLVAYAGYGPKVRPRERLLAGQ